MKEAKNKIDTVVAGAVKGVPQLIADRGKPVAVVLSDRDYQRLKRRQRDLASRPGT